MVQRKIRETVTKDKPIVDAELLINNHLVKEIFDYNQEKSMQTDSSCIEPGKPRKQSTQPEFNNFPKSAMLGFEMSRPIEQGEQEYGENPDEKVRMVMRIPFRTS